MKSNLFVFVLGSLLIFWSCQTATEEVPLPFYNSPDFTPEWVASDSPEFKQIHTIAPFKFANQNGDSISQRTFNDKIYVANFFFTSCPGICPKLTYNMTKIQDAFEKDQDVLLLSHTVTPWIDSIPRLRMYAEDKGINNDKWHLVTGEQEAIYEIARKSYFADKDIGFQKTPDDFLHTENFILVDKKQRIRGVYNGTLSLEMQRLEEDIRTLKKEG